MASPVLRFLVFLFDRAHFKALRAIAVFNYRKAMP